MRNRMEQAGLALGIGLALLAGGCEGEVIPVTGGQPELGALEGIQVLPLVKTMEIGDDVQFVAMGIYESGQSQPVDDGVTWSTSNADTVDVNTKGIVTAKIQGKATIIASVSSFTSSAQVNIRPALVSVQVFPPTSEVPIDLATSTNLSPAFLPFRAFAVYSDFSKADVTADATWFVDNPSIAASAGAGVFSGKSAGVAHVGFSYRGMQALRSSVLTVTDLALDGTALTVDVYGGTTLNVGTSTYIDTAAKFAGSREVTVTDAATWASSNIVVAAVDAGFVTARDVGTTTITATFKKGSQAQTASVTITVKSPAIEVTRIDVTGGATVALPVGVRTVGYTATATFSDNSTQDVSDVVTWTIGDPEDALDPGRKLARIVVSGGYLAQGVAPGDVNVYATFTKADESLVKGFKPFSINTGTPNAPTLRVDGLTALVIGGTTKLILERTYSNDPSTSTTGLSASAVWVSRNTNVAVVDNGSRSSVAGKVTAVGAGTASIEAYWNGALIGTATVTVTAP